MVYCLRLMLSRTNSTVNDKFHLLLFKNFILFPDHYTMRTGLFLSCLTCGIIKSYQKESPNQLKKKMIEFRSMKENNCSALKNKF